MGRENTQSVESFPIATARLFGGGRVTIPKPVRENLNLEDGDLVVIKLARVENE
ncbi:AbrB/MazE/SpoVT family DNA-binding domain-containing protein [Halorutilus salinus]|uniref:AbrB/MazE/SpoVT family DNA-binding domain-containing protein n=1 Tax=Halorutilus salinus TaxID=2487751 RepID=UPI0023EEFDFC|nr:AbrB/MazE/SpoVT family DNA-binding domain-containing protein [Halorutilus salinus]